MAYYYIIRGYYYIYYYIIICTFLHQWKAGVAQNACSACYNIASPEPPSARERLCCSKYTGLTGDIFRRRLSSAEIIFGGDNFRHHFRQISALISAEMFSNIKFSTVAIMDVPSPILGSVLLVARAIRHLENVQTSRIEEGRSKLLLLSIRPFYKVACMIYFTPIISLACMIYFTRELGSIYF